MEVSELLEKKRQLELEIAGVADGYDQGMAQGQAAMLALKKAKELRDVVRALQILNAFV